MLEAGDAAVLEAVDGRETVLQATGVGEGGGNSSVRSGKLADGSDQRGLSDIEASGDQYLQRESVTLHGLPRHLPVMWQDHLIRRPDRSAFRSSSKGTVSFRRLH